MKKALASGRVPNAKTSYKKGGLSDTNPPTRSLLLAYLCNMLLSCPILVLHLGCQFMKI